MSNELRKLGKLEEWALARVEDPERGAVLAAEVFERLTDGERAETLEGIAASKRFPKGVFIRWFATEHKDLLDAAERVLGIDMAQSVKAMTDGTTQETLGLMKFKTDRYLRLAEVMNWERYSRKQEVRHSGVVPVLVIELPSEAPRVERVVSEQGPQRVTASAFEI